MPLEKTRWLAGAACGATVLLAVAGCLRVFMMYCADVAPRMTRAWAPVLWISGAAFALAAGWIAFNVVRRATSAPLLIRRAGFVMLGLGVAVMLVGAVLFFGPHQAPVHPGRVPAGDVAGGLIAMVVGSAGAGFGIVGLLLVAGSALSRPKSC